MGPCRRLHITFRLCQGDTVPNFRSGNERGFVSTIGVKQFLSLVWKHHDNYKEYSVVYQLFKLTSVTGELTHSRKIGPDQQQYDPISR